MSVAPGPRFPVEPLLRAAGCYDHPGLMAHGGLFTRLYVSPSVALAVKLGYSSVREFCRETNWARTKKVGWTWVKADEVAVALGFHPADIWGEVWWKASEEAREAA